jgi:cytochrome b561
MGYYGGKGLPFFYKTFPGAETRNASITKNSFWVHKQLGVYGKYLVPLHVGAAGMHAMKGQPIFRRINPFAKSRG